MSASPAAPNRAATPAPASVTDRPPSYARMFDDRVKATPDRTAFQYPDGKGSWSSLTWKQTADRVYQLAAGLISLGVQPQDRVAIAASTRIEWILADQAVMSAAAATTTVYPNTHAEDVDYILSDSESVLLFAENAEQLDKLRGAALPALRTVVLFDDDRSASAPGAEGGTGTGNRAAELPPVQVLTLDELAERGAALLAEQPDAVAERIDAAAPEDLATLIYTSGTTGRPKGVRLVNDNWTYEGVAIDALDILTPDDVQYLWLPLSHVLGKVLLVAQIRIGFVTAVDGNLDKIVENLAAIRPTWMGGAPRIFEKVRNRATLTATSGGGLKAKIFSWAFGVGTRMSRAHQAKQRPSRMLAAQYALADKLVFGKIRKLLGGNIRFFVSGSAPLLREVAEWFDAAGMKILEGYGLTESSAFSFVNLPEDTRIGTVGPPAPGTEVIIASDGEIKMRGPGVMRGYHNNPEATDEVLSADGWLATGDIGELAGGYLKVTDRKKDLIKTSGGKYVAPQKVEGIFKALCPYASEIVVHGEHRKFISALITIDTDAVRAWADKNGMADVPTEELASTKQVHDLIAGYIDQLNEKLERWETIKKFAVLPHELSVDSGELTPSMKVRRRAVEKQYASILDSFYTD
ncbi:AMP-dependent synthetase/ligase [Nakamurella aerolata]|uniref:Acyl-CoA synthetase n=1 Tax=Nakamurella aerolata TaxID=1656892 RepID=A0A849A5E0_9ACTN|nr:long-chain fatty acid--CoA ligase [Nakamurella aerolata]NNG35779.1 long-chain fatty acid--CoA ligase [Nakamurella aerolata]